MAPPEAAPALVTLVGADRARAEPPILDSFTGIYRWHAKRTLRETWEVRAGLDGDRVVAVALLDRLAPEVGYVYYLAVRRAARRQGWGRRLLADAIERFREAGVEVVYAAVEEDNAPSLALFASGGFREVAPDEPGFREGGLGAWGFRSRMRVVRGERLLGRRLRARPPTPGRAAPVRP